MLDRVARLPGAPCLLAWGTRLGRVAFCHVNGLSRAISANRGEINRENMAARSEKNDSQSEEINVIDESQAKNRPVPVQEAEIRYGSYLGKVFIFADQKRQKFETATRKENFQTEMEGRTSGRKLSVTRR